MRWDSSHDSVEFLIWVGGKSVHCWLPRDAIVGVGADILGTPAAFLAAAKSHYELISHKAVEKALSSDRGVTEPIVLCGEDFPQ